MIPMLSADEARRRLADSKMLEGVNDPNVATAMSKLNVFRALLQNVPVTAAQSRLAATLMGSKTLDPRIREIVILRTGWLTKSEYEFCQHWAVSRQLKMTEEEILGVRDPARCTAYTDRDRAVLAMTDELHESSEVSAATWAKLAQSFSNPELVELIIVAGFWRMMAGFLKTSKIPFDPVDPTISGWPEDKAP
jgi:alkylhydroperoxidase family enzyme